MTKSKLIILAWLLLLIPTLLLGIGALRLLQSEQARLLASGQAAARDRVVAMAGNIDLAIGEVEDGLLETLRNLPQDNLPDRLEAWKLENPLVRNVFVWQRGAGLRLPDPERPASEEEANFIRRYLPLFANQADWQEPQRDQAEAPAADAQPQVSSVFTERQELRQLAKQAPGLSEPRADFAGESAGRPAAAPAAPAPPSRGATGGHGTWRSWYADDQLHLLGWYTPGDGNLRYGVEVEMMALLSRLLGNLAPRSGQGEAFALLDGNGAIFHQSGTFEIERNSVPLATSSILTLPHWQVAAYPDPSATGGSSGVLLIGSLLIGTFSAAILLGGSLLLWQAWRHQREARQKTSFVSNISHELKTPLTTIRMYAELLGEGKIEEADKQQRYLETIIRESRRLSRLVNNVLDFARLEQGRRQYRHEALDLAPLLGEVIESQSPRLCEAGLELDCRLPERPVVVNGERDALEQILLNLLDNAIKYAADGRRLHIDLQETERSVFLQLRDYGPGIPASHRQRIFDTFHRVDNSLTAERQGTGLGLSIARQLAVGLGGRLDYLPAQGGGSCFVLTLPLARE